MPKNTCCNDFCRGDAYVCETCGMTLFVTVACCCEQGCDPPALQCCGQEMARDPACPCEEKP